MRFTTKAPEPVETPVHLTLREQADGHVALRANGITLLWVRPCGRIMRNSADADRLRDLGFPITSGDRVALSYPVES